MYELFFYNWNTYCILDLASSETPLEWLADVSETLQSMIPMLLPTDKCCPGAQEQRVEAAHSMVIPEPPRQSLESTNPLKKNIIRGKMVRPV